MLFHGAQYLELRSGTSVKCYVDKIIQQQIFIITIAVEMHKCLAESSLAC